MLNTATPILQIKVSGIVLSDIKEMTVLIKNQTTTITKENADIEVDNDIISVFLTQVEAQGLNDGSFNVSISAVSLDDEDVTESIKVVWTKRGSMSKPVRDYYTKEEVDAKIQQIWDYIQKT